MYIPIWVLILGFLIYCWHAERPTPEEQREQRILDAEWKNHCRKERAYKRVHGTPEQNLKARLPEIVGYSIGLVAYIVAIVHWNIFKL